MKKQESLGFSRGEEVKELLPGDLSAAAAVVDVRAATAGAARDAFKALAERLRRASNSEVTSASILELGGNRTTPRAGALTPETPSEPRPQSDATGED